MKKLLMILPFLLISPTSFAEELSGLQGEPEATEKAEAMVEAMGGLHIWKEIKGIRFVNRWWHIDHKDTRIQDEIIDVTQSSTFFEMKSETYNQKRAYTPHSWWVIRNGEITVRDEAYSAQNAKRALFNLFRIAHGIATDSPKYQVSLNEEGWLEFGLPGGEVVTSVRLNAWNEPVIWKTANFRYTYGPMKRFGNVRVPNWAVYDEGLYRYEMISLETMTENPDPSVFEIPEEYRE